jgi:hypothetical protein
LGEIVRGTQICNFFEKIQPPTATEIKTNRVAVRGKIPQKLQILKLQYLDFPDSVSDDFFFKLGVFLRGIQIYNPFLQLYVPMLMILVCISLILAYSFVFLSLTLSSTAVLLSKTQLGMQAPLICSPR